MYSEKRAENLQPGKQFLTEVHDFDDESSLDIVDSFVVAQYTNFHRYFFAIENWFPLLAQAVFPIVAPP